MYGSSPIELLAADAMLRGTIFCNSFVYSAAWLTGTATALGAAASQDVQIQITAEADFVVQQLTFNSWSATGTIIADPDYTLNIAIASGRPWFNQAQSLRDICGSFETTVEPGYGLPFPRLIPSQSTITCSLSNRTNTASNRATLCMSGFNVYYQTENRQQVFHAL